MHRAPVVRVRGFASKSQLALNALSQRLPRIGLDPQGVEGIRAQGEGVLPPSCDEMPNRQGNAIAVNAAQPRHR